MPLFIQRHAAWLVTLAFVLTGCDEIQKQLGSGGELQPSSTPGASTPAPTSSTPADTPVAVTPTEPEKPAVVPSNPDEPFKLVMPAPTMMYTRIVRNGNAGLEFTGKVRIESGDISGTLHWYLEIKNRAEQLLREEIKFPEISKGAEMPFFFVSPGDDSGAPFLGRISAERDGKTLGQTEFTRFNYKRTK